MKTSAGTVPPLIGVTLLLSMLPLQAAKWADSEDSPLYASSMRNAFTEMAARDHAPPAQLQVSPNVHPDAVIVVEGKQWHMLTAVEKSGAMPIQSQTGGQRGPGPRDVTYVRTCANYATCDGSATCNGASTCIGASTCLWMPTCPASGQPTCGLATCQGYPSCTSPTCHDPTCPGSGQMTCWGITCSGPTCSATCGGNSTCIDTCTVGVCLPPTITGVTIPEPGQFQFSFYARGQLVSYRVLYCTNLDVAQWTTVFSLPANNTTVTFTHTNNAPKAYYRLSIQNL